MTDLIRKLQADDDYESNWRPRQRTYAGTARLAGSASKDMNSANTSGGVMRDALAAGRRKQLDVRGRPKSDKQMRVNADGEVEVFNPQEEYDKRKNDT